MRAATLRMTTGCMVAAFTLALAGCSSGESDRATTVEPTAEPEPTTTDSEEPKEAEPAEQSPEAAAALLSLDDMPSGWTTADGLGGDDEGPLCDAADVEPIGDAADEASAGFSGGDFGPFALHRVGVFDKTADAEAAIQGMLDQVEACRSYTDEDGTENEVQPLSFDRYADETVAFRQRSSSDEVEAVFDVITVRSGTAVMMVAVGQAFTTPDSELVVDLVETAVAKLD